MTPLAILKKAIKSFEKLGYMYCLIGGHAASIYRNQERFTKDVDFAVLTTPHSKSRKAAQNVIKDIGLKPMLGFIPTGKGEKERKSICMITSTPEKGETKGLIDIILPVLPWTERAVERAQYNIIDFGFAHVPVITPEDLIIAKCYALRNSPDRFQDLDDLKEIFISVTDLDNDYLESELQRHGLEIPAAVKKFYNR